MTTYHPKGHPMTTNPMKALLTKISEESVTTSNVLADMLDLLRERLPEPEGVKDEPDDLLGEPVEPGDLRAGDRVGLTFMGERITCTLVSDQDGDVLRSDTPAPDYYPNVTLGGREWCGGIFDVRLIERAPREGEDPDEALAKVLCRAWWGGDVDAAGDDEAWTHAARAAREHIEAEWEEVAKSFEDGRDKWQAEARQQRDRAEKAEAERDGWKAKHAALRADVEQEQRLRLYGFLRDIIDRDAARDPQADPDTVTLRRDDVAEVLEHLPADESCPQLDRVRDALEWGDEA